MRWPLEFPVERWPRLRRPEDWEPRRGERVLFLQGGGYPIITVRVLTPEIEPGKDLAGWDRRFIAPLSRCRLFPLPDWRETRAREDREWQTGMEDLLTFVEQVMSPRGSGNDF